MTQEATPHEPMSALIAMPALCEVDLRGTIVTEKGAAALKAARSGIVVYVGPWKGKSANYRNIRNEPERPDQK